MHPPGKILSCITAGQVLMHKLQAHCEAYEAIKRTPIGKGLQVGSRRRLLTTAHGNGTVRLLATVPCCVLVHVHVCVVLCTSRRELKQSTMLDRRLAEQAPRMHSGQQAAAVVAKSLRMR